MSPTELFVPYRRHPALVTLIPMTSLPPSRQSSSLGFSPQVSSADCQQHLFRLSPDRGQDPSSPSGGCCSVCPGCPLLLQSTGPWKGVPIPILITSLLCLRFRGGTCSLSDHSRLPALLSGTLLTPHGGAGQTTVSRGLKVLCSYYTKATLMRWLACSIFRWLDLLAEPSRLLSVTCFLLWI